MKWTWIYIALGGTFVVKLIESSRTIALINEAKQLKEVTKKPIMLISSSPRQGFDVYLNPNETVTWQLPYTNKAFASVVSDSLEDIPYPKQAMAEWMRVADTVLCNTHSIFSPEAWLDLRHHQVFMGQQTIPVNSSINWAIAGGVGYFFYRRHQRKLEGERIRDQEAEALPTPEEEEEEEVKALPPPKVEPAPLISPEEFMGLAVEESEPLSAFEENKKPRFRRVELRNPSQAQDKIIGADFKKGSINLGIGSDEAFNAELKAKGVENLAFDPQRLPEEHNRQILSQLQTKPADSATLFGVLDKVGDPEERRGALQVAYENVKPGGKVFIKVEEPKKHLTEVKRIFPGAKIKATKGYSQGIITAVK